MTPQERAATKNDGGSADYYQLPTGAAELQDLIEHKAMNFAVGNIFKAAYRLGAENSLSDRARDLRKIMWFARRELQRITPEDARETATDGPCGHYDRADGRCKLSGLEASCNECTGYVDASETARAAFTPRSGGTVELLSTALRALCLTRDYVEPNVSLPAKEGWEWFDAGVKLSAAIPDDKWAKEFNRRRAAFTPVQEEKVSEPISCGTCGHNGYGCTPDALVAGCHNWTRKAEGAATFPFTFPPALKWMGKSETEYDEKLIEEVDEVVKANDDRDRMVELFDVIQTSETAIRDLAEKTGLDPAEVADAMVVKNRVRGYYEPQG